MVHRQRSCNNSKSGIKSITWLHSWICYVDNSTQLHHNYVFWESTRNGCVLIDRHFGGNNQPKFPTCVKERFCGKPIMSCDVSFIVQRPVTSFFAETNEIEQEGICVANNTITFSNGSSTINCDTVQND